MMRRMLAFPAVVVLAGLAVGVWLTAARPLADNFLDGTAGDARAGALVFAAAGCAGCHAAPGATGDATRVLAGGRAFVSDFGTFYAPNISPGAMGIGGWSALDLANALARGIGRNGRHLYPALPYTSYRRITAGDVADLYAYLRTLPVADTPNRPNDVGFPFNFRPGLGGWKRLYLNPAYVMPAKTAEAERGRYLVEVLGHCAECHTPRNRLGAMDRGRWLQGAPNPSGRGTIPALTPDKLGWTSDEIVTFLSSGFKPDFDTAGGDMAEMVGNLSQLPVADLQAIAAYLLALPPGGT